MHGGGTGAGFTVAVADGVLRAMKKFGFDVDTTIHQLYRGAAVVEFVP